MHGTSLTWWSFWFLETRALISVKVMLQLNHVIKKGVAFDWRGGGRYFGRPCFAVLASATSTMTSTTTSTDFSVQNLSNLG